MQSTTHLQTIKYGILDTYILAIPFGVLGVHHFYLGRPRFALLYFLTFGLLGIGYLVDLFRIPRLVKEANSRIEAPLEPEKKNLAEAYLLWFTFGLFGFHHFYLRRYEWGIAYLLTLGFFGVGWVVDCFRMKSLVKEYNETEREIWAPRMYLFDAYVFTIIPVTGVFGLQHYYLGRYKMGFIYTLTFGLVGIGWFVDLFRMPILVKERNKQIMEGNFNNRTVRLDDAYLLLIVFGHLGLHHFYLKRPRCGFLYFLTNGLCSIGYLIDFFRLPYLVRDYNRNVQHQQLLTSLVSGNVNYGAIVSTSIPPPLPSPSQDPTDTQYPGLIQPNIPGAQVPSYQPPYYPYPQQGMYPSQQIPAGYDGAGPSSINNINPNECQPPSHTQAMVEDKVTLPSEHDEQMSEPSNPLLYKKD